MRLPIALICALMLTGCDTRDQLAAGPGEHAEEKPVAQQHAAKERAGIAWFEGSVDEAVTDEKD